MHYDVCLRQTIDYVRTIARTVPVSAEFFHPLDDVLSLRFLPALLLVNQHLVRLNVSFFLCLLAMGGLALLF